MGNANEYQKLLEPPSKQEKASEGRIIDVIYGQCNESKHSKEHCHQNPNNLNNKLKDTKEVVVNGVSTQFGGIKTKSSNKGAREKVNKSSSIIYRYFICNSIEQKNYDYLYKDASQAVFNEKATMATPMKDNVVVNMILAVKIHIQVLENVVFKEKEPLKNKNMVDW